MLLCCAIPSVGRVFARLGWSILLAPALIGLADCTPTPGPHLARRAAAAATMDSVKMKYPGLTDHYVKQLAAMDSVKLKYPGLTDHYVKLLRAQLTAEDPYQAAVAIHCEQRRVMTRLTNEADNPLQGENAAVALLKEATTDAYTPSDRQAQDRVDRALDGRVFDAQEGCDSLARAGVLGDTVMPRLRPRPF